MPKIIVQTDDGVTIDTHEFPVDSAYAMVYMPGCPTHTGVHDLLNWLKRTVEDAEHVQKHGTRPPERASEQVMRILHERGKV